jgi:hypothetical protein
MTAMPAGIRAQTVGLSPRNADPIRSDFQPLMGFRMHDGAARDGLVGAGARWRGCGLLVAYDASDQSAP